jgi:hypothetical protein
MPIEKAILDAFKVLLWRSFHQYSPKDVSPSIRAFALLQAIKKEDPVLVKAILDLGNIISSLDRHGLYSHPVGEALSNGCSSTSLYNYTATLEIVKLLLEAGYVPHGFVCVRSSMTWVSPIFRAITVYDESILKLLTPVSA